MSEQDLQEIREADRKEAAEAIKDRLLDWEIAEQKGYPELACNGRIRDSKVRCEVRAIYSEVEPDAAPDWLFNVWIHRILPEGTRGDWTYGVLRGQMTVKGREVSAKLAVSAAEQAIVSSLLHVEAIV